MRFGSFDVIVDQRDDIAARNPEPGRMILNLAVEDARAVVERMDTLDMTWLAELEDRDGSLFANAIDPDGNYVQLIELSAEHRAEAADARYGPAGHIRGPRRARRRAPRRGPSVAWFTDPAGNVLSVLQSS